MALLDLCYYSHALGMQTAATVILPQDSPGPYQVMFLLHGRSDDHTIWTRRTSIERYVEGLPLIVVMPNGHRGFYVDMDNGYPYGKAVGEELPALIRNWFSTVDVWSITGLSMGGYGALRTAFNYPDLFKSAVSHSGALIKFGEGIALDRSQEDLEWYRTFGTAPHGGPNDLFQLAETHKDQIKIRIDCGTEDFLLEENRRYTAHLNEIGYQHEYEEFAGTHEWGYWDTHVQEAIAFHRKNLNF